MGIIIKINNKSLYLNYRCGGTFGALTKNPLGK